MKNENGKAGLNITETLQLVFVVLKLTGLVSWTWFQVFLPSIIGLGLSFICLVLIALLNYAEKAQRRRLY